MKGRKQALLGMASLKPAARMANLVPQSARAASDKILKTGVNLMQNLKGESQKSQQPERNGAERRNPPKFDNNPLVVKDYNIIVFFIYNLFFAPLAVPVFLYIGDTSHTIRRLFL